MTEPAAFAIPYRRAWAAATAAFLVHNVEEVARDLPDWVKSFPLASWLNWMSDGRFAIAVAVLTVAVGALALFCIATGPRWSRLALSIFAIVMLLNAASHVALSLWTSSLMPGVVTAALVITPVMIGVLWAILRKPSPFEPGQQ